MEDSSALTYGLLYNILHSIFITHCRLTHSNNDKSMAVYILIHVKNLITINLLIWKVFLVGFALDFKF